MDEEIKKIMDEEIKKIMDKLEGIHKYYTFLPKKENEKAQPVKCIIKITTKECELVKTRYNKDI